MELALYCPVCGFYEKENDTLGKRGDFYTSVSVGSLFGELLAFQFADWLTQVGEESVRSENGTLKIVEAGAHDGKLASDILNWLQLRRPELARQIEYWIIEPSARRQQWQRQTLKDFIPHVRWLQSIATQHAAPINGIIFSNELLDAMPVHRLGWDAQRREWFEWRVTIDGERFAWTRSADSLVRELWETNENARTRLSALRALPPDLLEALPDGFSTEISPAAETWWREAAHSLEAGKLLTVDYGLNADQFISPGRKDGTLRGYHRHRQIADVLANPGEQDLTAHVNFTEIQSAGERAGLKTEVFDTQARFLTDIAARVWKEGSGFGPWTSQHTREFQTLTHPEFMGRSFHVLVQER